MLELWLWTGVAVFIYFKWCFSDVKNFPKQESSFPHPLLLLFNFVSAIICWPIVLFICGWKEGAYTISGLDFDSAMRMSGYDDWKGE